MDQSIKQETNMVQLPDRNTEQLGSQGLNTPAGNLNKSVGFVNTPKGAGVETPKKPMSKTLQ